MRLFELFTTLYHNFNKKKTITDVLQEQVFEISTQLSYIIPHLSAMIDRHNFLKKAFEKNLLKNGNPTTRLYLQKTDPLEESVLAQLIVLDERCKKLFDFVPAAAPTLIEKDVASMNFELDRAISYLKKVMAFIEIAPHQGSPNELKSLNDRLREITDISKSTAEFTWKLDELKARAQKRFKGLQITPELVREKMPLLFEVFEKSRPNEGTSPEYHLDKKEENTFVTQMRLMNDFHDSNYRVECREWWNSRPISESDLGFQGAPHINIDKMTYRGVSRLKLHVFFDSRSKNKKAA